MKASCCSGKVESSLALSLVSHVATGWRYAATALQGLHGPRYTQRRAPVAEEPSKAGQTKKPER